MDTDLLNTGEAADALSMTEPTRDVSPFIEAISLWVDNNYGPMVERTITSESHDGGKDFIILNNWPVVSVTEVIEYSGTTATTLTNSTNVAQTSTDYHVTLKNGLLRRRNTNFVSCWTRGQDNIVVTYIAGRFATTNDVASDVKLAARIMLRHLYQAQYGAGSDVYGDPSLPAAFAIPNQAKELLDSTYGQLPGLLVG